LFVRIVQFYTTLFLAETAVAMVNIYKMSHELHLNQQICQGTSLLH